jgi:GNAT superfamily N-acetyltransferase
MTAKFRIRRATPADLEVIGAMQVTIFPHKSERIPVPHAPGWKKYKKTEWWYCVYDDAMPAGFLCLEQVSSTVAYLSRVGTLQGARGNGLMVRMMRTAEQYLKRHTDTVLFLSDTLPDNPASMNSFIKAGWETTEQPSRLSLQRKPPVVYWRKELK